MALAACAGGALAQQASTLDTLTVTGTRGQTRTVAAAPAPIDVVPAAQLQTIGRDGLQEALNALLPSYNLPAMTGSGTGGVVRAAGLRGLNADQVLVLVDGKRRHNSALLQSSSWTSSGATPADLDLIPVSAIDHIEILRDGAAAQYGSDAIAGVINIILKRDDSGGQAQLGWGSNYEGDGITVQQSVSHGFALPNDGFLHLALDNRDQDNYTRADKATRYDADGNSQGLQLINQGYGNPKTQITNLSYNAELPLSGDAVLYSFATAAHREGWKHANFRQANANGNLVELYPDGASPRQGLRENDYQFVFGARDDWGGWNADLSTSYSHDKVRLLSHNNLNPTLGPDSPRDFRLGAQVFAQWTNNLDLTRGFDTGLAKPTQVSWGLEHRYEKWELRAGEADSYRRGDYVYTDGPYAGRSPNAATGVRGISPDDAGSADRNVYAGYAEVGIQPTDKWYAALALRHERYDDSAGNTTNGKLTTRYEFTPQFALRATASTGFRAPSLAQNTYQQSTVSAYQATTDGYVQYYYKLLSPTSAIAQALGAQALKPEKSRNYSLGFSWTPLDALSVTLDAYQIDIDDRIVLSDVLTDASVVALLESYGLNDFNGAQFYTNAVDTRTRGVDLVAEYRADYGRIGRVRWNASYNHNETELQHVDDSVVLGTQYPIFGHSARTYLLRGNPRDKLILGGDWRLGPWGANLRVTRYGEVTQPGSTAATDRTFGAKWIADLSVDRGFANGLTLTVGANNLFDSYPDKIGIVSSTGLGAYGYISPFGFGGGYYYARLAYNF
ncbi:TonB-dependent receptor [Xanthomonas sp. AmX2]|uniref:TonB-dependent receptor plug domain-containing protein n=1 Tax=Xanthomonas sp. TaxID=29446 RepID=UPI00197D03A8|nr:TonB-dependent receptor [Xanthomonas sp.]MBN6151876.1 TonB-dependent receptor [Xanthomonas sp.]